MTKQRLITANHIVSKTKQLSPLSLIGKIMFAATVYAIWGEGNPWIHNNGAMLVSNVIRDFCLV